MLRPVLWSGAAARAVLLQQQEKPPSALGHLWAPYRPQNLDVSGIRL